MASETRGTPPERHDPYAPLREPNFRRYLIGNMCASAGKVMLATAIGWDIYERTGSALALGWVGLVLFIPVVFFAIPAGQLADRIDRRKIVMTGLCVVVLTSLGMAAVSHYQAPVAAYYVLLFLMGSAQSFYGPARSALLPSLVSPANLSGAISWSTGAFQLAFLTGPAIAGALIAQFHGATVVYLVDTAAALIYLVALSGITYTQPPREAHAPGLADALAGLKFVWTTQLILAAITLDMLAVLFGGAVALLPIFAKDILKVGPQGLGWLLAAPAVGAFLMGLVLAHRPPIRRSGPILLLTVAGFGLATVGFALSRNIAVAWAMLFLTGVFDLVSMVIRSNLVQHLTPEAMRGRVQAVHGLFVGTSNELGGFESGLTASWWGPVRAVVVGGVGTMAVVAIAAWKWPELRALGEVKSPEAEG
jgi:MFS family permease